KFTLGPEAREETVRQRECLQRLAVLRHLLEELGLLGRRLGGEQEVFAAKCVLEGRLQVSLGRHGIATGSADDAEVLERLAECPLVACVARFAENRAGD